MNLFPKENTGLRESMKISCYELAVPPEPCCRLPLAEVCSNWVSVVCAAPAEPDVYFSGLRETGSHTPCSQLRAGRSIALYRSSCPTSGHHHPRPPQWHFPLTTTLLTLLPKLGAFFKAQPIAEAVVLRGQQGKWPYAGRGTLGD